MSENYVIGYEPEIDFTDIPIVKIKNGAPVLIDKIKAIRQWIVKFASTDLDAYPIYEGTGFGNRAKRLFGRKQIGYGYEEAEIERDYREGLILCPAISDIASFEIKKEGKYLNIDIEVSLYDGSLVDVTIEKAYILQRF